MKKIILIYSVAILAVFATGCTKDGIDDDLSFVNTGGSNNLSQVFKITDDNSGNVTITPLGEGFTKATVSYGDGSTDATVTAGTNTTHSYAEGSYTVTITSYDISGKATTNTYPLQVMYRAPENVQIGLGSDVKVSATALYANSFTVFYGDVVGETGTPLAVGATLPAHIYPAGGPYDLKVVANSGGAAKTTVTKTLFGFPLTFESPTMDYFFGTFGDVVFSKVANPAPGGLNTSATVGKYTKPNGVPNWSGTYSPLNIALNLAQGKKIKVLVYNPDPANIGKQLNVELEAAIDNTGATPNGVGVLKAPITTSGAWEELTFDFSTIPAIGASARFGQLVLRFNDAANGAGEVIYLDDFRLTN